MTSNGGNRHILGGTGRSECTSCEDTKRTRDAQTLTPPAAQVMAAPVLGDEDELMERRTLNQITNRTRRGDLVLYYHSKGVSSRRVNQEPGARCPLRLRL